MPFAFVRIEEVEGQRPGSIRQRSAVRRDSAAMEADGVAGTFAMFGAMAKGWGLAYTNIPLQYFIADPSDYFLLSEIGGLNQTVKDLPPARRQAMNTWLTNKGYNTGWIGPNTTIKAVLKDILHHLTNRTGVPDNLIRWCQDYMSD